MGPPAWRIAVQERSANFVLAEAGDRASLGHPVARPGDRVIVRLLSGGVGLGAALFGLPALVVPGWFARQFGIAASDQQSVATAIRSVGIRDVVIGLGLLHAVTRGEGTSLHDWLLARAVSDAGDTIAVGIAVARGERNPRFVGLGVMAASASVVGVVLLRACAAARSRPGG